MSLSLSTNEGIIHRRLMNPIVRKLGELGAETGQDMTTLRSAAKPPLIRAKTDSEFAKRMKEISEAVSSDCSVTVFLIKKSFSKNLDRGAGSESFHLFKRLYYSAFLECIPMVQFLALFTKSFTSFSFLKSRSFILLRFYLQNLMGMIILRIIKTYGGSE